MKWNVHLLRIIFFLSQVVRAWNDFVLERKPLAGIDGRLRSEEDEEKEKDKDLLAKAQVAEAFFSLKIETIYK